MPHAMPYTTPVHQLRGQRGMQRSPVSLAYLRGVSPNDVPYSDEERSYARGQRAGDLAARDETYAAQRRIPGMTPGFGVSPSRESEIASIAAPTWSRFFDQMADVPNLAANRGMRGRADLAGRGVGTGTGIGRMKAETGEFDASGSFRNTGGPAVDLEDLLDDARRPDAPGELAANAARQRSMAMQALNQLMRGR